MFMKKMIQEISLNIWKLIKGRKLLKTNFIDIKSYNKH